MALKHLHLSMAVLTCALALGACTNEAPAPVSALQPSARSNAEAPAASRKTNLEKPVEDVPAHDPVVSTAPSANDADFGPIDVPAYDDLLKQATSEITAANAEAELAKLKSQLTVGG